MNNLHSSIFILIRFHALEMDKAHNDLHSSIFILIQRKVYYKVILLKFYLHSSIFILIHILLAHPASAA